MPKTLSDEDKKFIGKEVSKIAKKMKKRGIPIIGTGEVISKNIGMYLNNNKEYEVRIREIKH